MGSYVVIMLQRSHIFSDMVTGQIDFLKEYYNDCFNGAISFQIW